MVMVITIAAPLMDHQSLYMIMDLASIFPTPYRAPIMLGSKLPHKQESVFVDAKPEVIWMMLTDKEWLAKWWCLPSDSGFAPLVNLMPGGLFKFETTEYKNNVVYEFIYVQVIPYKRLVFTNALTRDLKPSISPYAETVVFNLTPDGSGTRLTIDILMKTLPVLKWVLTKGSYRAWIANLTFMTQLAVEYQKSITNPSLLAQPDQS
jgi:uncharacterized protein YndB with AHSA1/START domain